MTIPEPIKAPLQDMARAFEGCALWAARAILEADVTVKTPFQVRSSLPEGSSLYCILPAASRQFYSQLVMGIQESELGELFPQEQDEKIRKDAVGEMANVISGLFLADDAFVATFGYLRPSTPFFSEGAFTARKDWGLRGSVEANGKEMTILFSIRDLRDAPSAEAQSAGALQDPEGRPA